MARPRSKDDETAPLYIGIDKALKTRLEAAAEQSVRSLTGEVIHRLRKSFGEQSDTPAAA